MRAVGGAPGAVYSRTESPPGLSLAVPGRGDARDVVVLRELGELGVEVFDAVPVREGDSAREVALLLLDDPLLVAPLGVLRSERRGASPESARAEPGGGGMTHREVVGVVAMRRLGRRRRRLRESVETGARARGRDAAEARRARRIPRPSPGASSSSSLRTGARVLSAQRAAQGRPPGVEAAEGRAGGAKTHLSGSVCRGRRRSCSRSFSTTRVAVRTTRRRARRFDSFAARVGALLGALTSGTLRQAVRTPPQFPRRDRGPAGAARRASR